MVPKKNPLVQVEVLEAQKPSFLHSRLPAYPHVRYVLASRRIHQMRDRVVAREKLRPIEGDRAQVGEFARRERADRGVEAESARAVQRGRGASLMRRHRLGVVGYRLAEQRRSAHLL